MGQGYAFRQIISIMTLWGGSLTCKVQSEVKVTSPGSDSWLVGETVLCKQVNHCHSLKLKFWSVGAGVLSESECPRPLPHRTSRAAFHNVAQAGNPSKVRPPCGSPSHLVMSDQPGNP